MDEQELKKYLEEIEINYRNGLTAFFEVGKIIDLIRQNNGGR